MRGSTALVFTLCCLGGLAATARQAPASSAVTLSSRLSETRTSIPVTIDGRNASCILDTGSSAMLVSPTLARSAGLIAQGGTFEVAPDGRTYTDRETQIARFSVAGHLLHDVPALISTNLSGDNALCGYDFFAHFPTLIDRAHEQVTLFPPSSKTSRLHCLAIDLSPRVPLATVEVNGTWLNEIVLDSGMAGGGALWDGVRSRLREPLVTSAGYATMPPTNGFSCGGSAFVRFAAGSAATPMPICTEHARPDGYNGILETNLPSIAQMAVDYPHRKICFDVADFTPALTPASAPAATARSDAWSRFNSLRPPL